MRRSLALAALLVALVPACSEQQATPPAPPVTAASAVPATDKATEVPAPAVPAAPAAPPGPHDYRLGVLPKGFPLPLPEDTVVVGGIETPVAEGTSYHVTIKTKLPTAAAIAFYEKAFKAKKLTVEKVGEDVLGAAITSVTGRAQTATASALVSQEVDGTKVALTWEPDGIPVRHAPGKQPKP
jgi:hypothetical protein